MRTELLSDALTADAGERGSLTGAIRDSDHGAQYTWRTYADLCAGLGLTHSMGALGSSADNALAEVFNVALEWETLVGAADSWDSPGNRLAARCSPGTPATTPTADRPPRRHTSRPRSGARP
jgi:transposase InsO family protein